MALGRAYESMTTAWLMDALDQAQRFELLERSIDRHQPHGWMSLSGAFVYFAGIQGLVRLGQDLDDGPSRRRHPTAI